MQQMVAHCVCSIVEELSYLLFALVFEIPHYFMEQFNIVSTACFEDLFFWRGTLGRGIS